MLSLGLSLAPPRSAPDPQRRLAELATWFCAGERFNAAGSHQDAILLDQPWFLSAGIFDPIGAHSDAAALV